MKKYFRAAAAILAALALSACGGPTEPATTAPDSTAPPTTHATNAPDSTSPATRATQPEPVYTFADSAVQRIVEDYLGKSAAEFTQEDLDALGQVETFRLWGEIGTIADIPALFPSLKFLDLNYNGDNPISEADCGLIFAMGLDALRIYSGGFPRTDFAGNCSFVSLNSYFDAESTAADALAHAPLADAEADLPEGYTIDGYTRYMAGEYIFELVDARTVISRPETNFEDVHIWSTLYIHRLESSKVKLAQAVPIQARAGNLSAGLHYFDADFDGHRDILVANGHFGTQGLVNYTCLLWRDGRFVQESSFTDIPNPTIDAENELLLGTWRNSAASHSWAWYEYKGGQFIMTACLTEEGYLDDNDELSFIFRDERLVDGVMQTVSEINAKDYTEEQIIDMYYAPDSEWGLFGDRWLTLFNRGSVPNFSIYNSSSVDSTIYDIITSPDPRPAVIRDSGGTLVYSTYPVEETYYSKSGKSYAQLSLRMPILGGDYAGIPAINAHFAGRELHYAGEIGLDTILSVLEDGEVGGRYYSGRDDNCYREALFSFASKRGDILSLSVKLDGGAGGVGWAGVQGYTFDLATGKKLAIGDLFAVPSEEYREAIYQLVADIAQARIDQALATGDGSPYWFDDSLSEEGRACLYDSWQEEDFYLTDRGLVIVYQKYTLAPGVGGPQEFEIPFARLKGLLAGIL